MFAKKKGKGLEPRGEKGLRQRFLFKKAVLIVVGLGPPQLGDAARPPQRGALVLAVVVGVLDAARPRRVRTGLLFRVLRALERLQVHVKVPLG